MSLYFQGVFACYIRKMYLFSNQLKLWRGTKVRYMMSDQVIPGNDQNMYPTNQKTPGSKLERTSYLMFYGSRRHLKSFSGNFFGVNLFTGIGAFSYTW